MLFYLEMLLFILGPQEIVDDIKNQQQLKSGQSRKHR